MLQLDIRFLKKIFIYTIYIHVNIQRTNDTDDIVKMSIQSLLPKLKNALHGKS
jgi:hypothetical protein